MVSGAERRVPSPSAAQVLLETLRLHGVDRIFQVPGESFLALLDALYDEHRIELFTCRHESAAGFMALADARLTGGLGVFLATRGPGASNASIAVHAAEQDAAPLLLIVGQVPRKDIGRGALQEVDLRAMYGGLAKFVAEIHDPERISEITARAIRIAFEGVPGPVVLSIPEDTLAMSTGALPVGPSQCLAPQASARALEAAAARIARAERPLLIAGGALEPSGGREALERFAQAWRVPVCTSFRRMDLFPNDHELYAGPLTIDVPQDQRAALENADLVIAVGTRLGDFTTLGYRFPRSPQPRQPLIHVHAAPRVVGAQFATELGVLADPLEFLAALAGRPPGPVTRGRLAWIETLAAIQRRLATWEARRADDGVVHNNVVAALEALLPPDAIVTTDAGTHAGGAYRYLRYSRGRRLIAPLSGSMGCGVPAGVAAALRYPGRRVLTFVGDGGFLMTGAELLTAIQRRLPLCVVLGNNNSYASVRLFQEKAYPGRVVGTALTNPDFVHLAAAFGCAALRIEREEEIDSVLRQALACDGPAVVEVKTSLKAILPDA